MAGNIKIAKLEGHQEAIIESRGRGGYVWIYDQFVQGKSYSGIKYIDDESPGRFQNTQNNTASKKVQQEHENEIKWDDYNKRFRFEGNLQSFANYQIKTVIKKTRRDLTTFRLRF